MNTKKNSLWQIVEWFYEIYHALMRTGEFDGDRLKKRLCRRVTSPEIRKLLKAQGALATILIADHGVLRLVNQLLQNERKKGHVRPIGKGIWKSEDKVTADEIGQNLSRRTRSSKQGIVKATNELHEKESLFPELRKFIDDDLQHWIDHADEEIQGLFY